MKAYLVGLCALLIPHMVTSAALAQSCSPYPYYPGNPFNPPGPPHPIAPDACGPGFYCANRCGMVYGPNHYLRPPCQPFNGWLILPAQYQGGMYPAARIAAMRAPAYGYPPAAGYPPVGYAPPGYPPAYGMPAQPGYPAVGMAPPRPPGAPGILNFPTHPFARSPRDYFMDGETTNDY